MRVFLSITTLIFGLFILTGCPVSSVYPLGEKGDVELDPRLIGTFSNSTEDAEVKKLVITKGSEINTYDVHVEEKGEMFMAEGDDFVSWLTILNEQTFFVLQQIIEGESVETYFVYQMNFTPKGIRTSDISLKVNGTNAITSIEAYREEVKASMAMEDFLTGGIDWVKN